MVTGDKSGQKWYHDNYVCLITHVMEKDEEIKKKKEQK